MYKKDLTGKIFGKLRVIECANIKNKRNRLLWRCVCECGREKLLDGCYLKRVNSCGKCKRERANLEPMEGKRFGKLLVVEEKYRKNGGRIWECLCDCGRTHNVETCLLNGGQVKSCGCSRGKNLVGQEFGRLTVIEETEKRDSGGGKIYKCKCNCGTELYVKSKSLMTNHTTSCGCKSRKNYRNDEIYGVYLKKIEKQAKTRNIYFDLSIDYLRELYQKQNKKCALSGLDINFEYQRFLRNKTTASLDRIDPQKGYEVDNVQWVHKYINFMKYKLPQDIFIELCKKVVEYNASNHSGK